MKIFSSEQIRQWDKFTIENEPVSSIHLMERAANACYDWISKNYNNTRSFKFFCGKGNNGGDGLALARMLIESNYNVFIYIPDLEHNTSIDFETNFERLQKITNHIYFIKSAEEIFFKNESTVIIDALFGTGLNKPLKGLIKELAKKINDSNSMVISIDIPSGLFTDKTSKENTVIKANVTLTFQATKLAFLMAENESFFGKIILLDIALSSKFFSEQPADKEFIDKELIYKIYKPRSSFSNKGDFGYACLLAGSYGMMGAAVLSAKACLKSGVGKLTCFIPAEGYQIMQTCAPEAMSKVQGKKFLQLADSLDIDNFDSLGIGPGIGIHASHVELLRVLFKKTAKPVVIDADALNIIAKNKKLLASIPANSIITPHPKEFERLFGKSANDFERMELALKKAVELKIFIVLKGHHTLICSPDNKAFFNSTGNAGMATGGSGDVLTGILTGLLAQKYSSLDACILGVYLHGLAGDIAAEKVSEEAMIAGDIIENLGKAFKTLQK